VIPLPDGFAPEGIATGYGPIAFAGSLVDGAIWRGNLRTGAGDVWVEGEEGRVAVGLDFDERTGNLWVSGGPGGDGRVYDGETGEELAVVPLAGGFINDVIVTSDTAYFTNSFAPELYAVPLGNGGEPVGEAQVIPLTGEFQFEAGQFNANGIVTTQNERWLIVANSFAGEIYRVDPSTGFAEAIDLGGTSVSGDGLLLVGRTLYAVENVLNRVAEIRLSGNVARGAVVEYLTSPNFDVPTTVAVHGRNLYLVNARFGTPVTPETEYDIVRVHR
jgi:sugar lactone lactonase YvrE